MGLIRDARRTGSAKRKMSQTVSFHPFTHRPRRAENRITRLRRQGERYFVDWPPRAPDERYREAHPANSTPTRAASPTTCGELAQAERLNLSPTTAGTWNSSEFPQAAPSPRTLLAPKPAAPAGRPGRDPNSVSSTGLAFLSSQFFTYFVEVFVLDRVWILV